MKYKNNVSQNIAFTVRRSLSQYELVPVKFASHYTKSVCQAEPTGCGFLLVIFTERV